VRKALIGSLIVHVGVVIGLFSWIAFSQVKYVPRTDTYIVKVVGSVSEARAAAPAKAEAVPAPPRPAPVEEKKEEPKPDQMEAPPEKPKPKPKKEEAKAKAEVPTTDITKTDAKPDTSMDGVAKGEGIPGPTGDTPAMGSVSIDGGEFPFASYINRMRQKIATTWEVPPGSEGFERNAVVYFRIHRNGSVSNVNVEQSSTLPLFDRSCQRAIIEAAPMPPLPREYGEEYIGVHFTFQYQPTP
jgi:protein TonB